MLKMTIKTAFLAVMLFIVYPTQARTRTEQDIPVTRNLLGIPLPTRNEYLARFPKMRLIVHDVERYHNGRDEEGTVVVAVNHGLLNALEEGFNRFVDDIADTGFEVVLIDVEGGTPAEFKELLIEEGGDDIAGAILAGELPLAWFELLEYFDDEDEPDNPRFAEFPIDLFFMDTDGTWQDTSGNGIYDVHADSWEPDIWIGRLPAYNLSRLDEVTVVSEYLEKVHRYRMGDLSLPHKALNFVDDDWVDYAADWGDDVALTYGFVLTEAEPESTSAVNYSRELESDGYELVQVCVHSTASSHIFWVNGHNDYDYFRFPNLRDEVSPNVMFYNLYACSNMNLATNLPMGALYALGGPYGLGSIGSSKTGAMLYFDDYYRWLGEGESFGEAFRRWFTEHGNQPEHENWARSWFYGMTYFGDPTLKPTLGIRVSDLIVSDDNGGDDDGLADAGESVDLSVVLINHSLNNIEGIEIELSSEDNFVEVVEGESYLNQLDPDDLTSVDGFALTIAEECPDRHKAALMIRMSPEGEEPWFDRFLLEIFSPKVQPVGFSFAEIDGNDNGWVGPGETGDLYLNFRNVGGDDLLEDGRVDLRSLDDLVEVLSDDIFIPGIAPGSDGLSQPVRYRVAEDADYQRGVLLQASVSHGEIERGGGMFIVPLAPEFDFNEDLDIEPLWFNSYSLSPGYNNCWRWSEDAGEHSAGIAFGGPDSSFYPGHADAVLELPMMMFEEDAILELRHRMFAEEDYDGGMIEINRGDDWELAVPEAGYNGNAVDNGSFPGGECWNGVFDWRDDQIHIEGPRGTLIIRFRFASDNAVEMIGWFIDSIRLNGTPFAVDENFNSPGTFGFENVYPNPFNNSFKVDYYTEQSGEVRLRLYDVSGRKIDTLTEELHEAGSHCINYNASGLPAGVYLLKIDCGTYSRMAKAVLVK